MIHDKSTLVKQKAEGAGECLREREREGEGGRESDRQTDRQTERETDRQTDRQTLSIVVCAVLKKQQPD